MADYKISEEIAVKMKLALPARIFTDIEKISRTKINIGTTCLMWILDYSDIAVSHQK